MNICGQTFRPEILGRIQNLVDNTRGLSRRSLSRSVCEWLDWRHPDGRLKDMSCRKALSQLHRIGHVNLPEAIRFPANVLRRSESDHFNRSPVICSLSELGTVTLILVENRLSEHAHIWKSLMAGHYLGARLFCAGLRYLIHSSTQGWLGALAFSTAAFRVTARDRFIDWDEQSRQCNLERVISNSRFFIHPSVKVPHLASHALGKVLRRVKDDWHVRYGRVLLLVETFVEQGRFLGISYRASNWLHVGATTGQGRQDAEHTATLTPKEMYVYPLHRRWREQLGGSCHTESTLPSRPTSPVSGINMGKGQLKGARFSVLIRFFGLVFNVERHTGGGGLFPLTGAAVS